MRAFLLGLLLLILSPLLHGEVPPAITFDQGQITVLRDKSKQLTLEQARAAHAEGQFKPLAGHLGLGYIPDVVWLRVSIAQENPAARWLEVMPPYLDDIRLFHLRSDGKIDVRRSGDSLPQSSKEEPYRGHLFKLDFQPGDHEIFIRLQTTSTMAAIVKLWQPREFEQHLRSSYFGFGLYFSLMLTVLLFNAANWLVARRTIFLVYVGYLLIISIQWLGINGFTSEFLLPERPDLANMSVGLMISLVAAMAWLFFMMILELKRYHPFLHRLSQFGISISLATFVATLLGYYQIFMAILLMVGTVSLLTVPWPIWRLWKTGEVWARLLALAYLLYALLSLFNILGTLAIFPFNEWNILAGMASNMAHVLFLHFAILLHYRRIEADHAAALEKAALAERQATLDRAHRAEQDKLLRMMDERTTELEVANKKLAALSNTDGLTGLANRRRFNEVLNAEFLRLKRSEAQLSLLMIDVDHFKKFNDRYGHIPGDNCLTAVGQAIHSVIGRASDLAARYGGEEFAVIAPETNASGARSLAERIRQSVEALAIPHAANTAAPHITISIGVVTRYATEMDIPETIVSLADRALYRAKEAGRNRVEITVGEHDDEPRKGQPGLVRLVWKDIAESGNESLDREHQSLFDLANLLLSAAVEGASKEECTLLLNQLLNAVVTHFSDEEALLATTNFPDIEHHARCHQELVAKALDMAERFERDELPVGDLFSFLAYDVVAQH
ncbi:MAG: diguanylate cyclase, partial [Rhodoferax sp.]|nr:diguanylate cyclase [Rhodoferax sp.]